MKTATKWMVGAIVMAVGCGTPSDKNNDKPEPFKNVTLELRNVGTASIWIGVEFPVRILVGEDDYLPLESCSCRECPLTGEADAQPARTEIRPGSAWSHLWNGAVMGDGSDCPDLKDHLGEELIAEFCFGKNIDGPDQWSGGIADIECVRKPFTLGEDTTVVAEIDHSVPPDGSIPVILENGTDAPIFAQITDNCGSGTFFTVRFGDEVIQLGSICGPCDCSAGDECFVGCDAACEAPRFEELAPGATAERDFQLTYRKVYDEGTYQCTQQHLVPAGPLTASICYGTSVVDEFESGYGTVADPVCEDVEFTIADDEVRLVVTGPIALP